MSGDVVHFPEIPRNNSLTVVIYEDNTGNEHGFYGKVSVGEALTCLRDLVWQLESLREQPRASAWIMSELGRLRLIAAR